PYEWRSLLRDLLRQCSFLPDPIAQAACHDHVMQRFRRWEAEKRPWVKYKTIREHNSYKDAHQKLSLLIRANEGFPRPLEKVLRFAYGRSGKRRWELLSTLLTENVPADSNAVEHLISTTKADFGDDWKPPTVLVDLLKSQNNNPFVAQLSNRPPVKELEPKFPKKVTWGGGVAFNRRKNIRRDWYNNVLSVILPPLPDSELQVLEGLISGKITWKRRSKTLSEGDFRFVADHHSHPGRRVRRLLSYGPRKEQTFEAYASGRPHTITRRLMTRLWQRISCLVPRSRWDTPSGKHYFTWDTVKPLP
ncbi:hypothetical protein P175DRAFT_0405436, partial [Aspergillus ochraceoroseus IBT 24754]